MSWNCIIFSELQKPAAVSSKPSSLLTLVTMNSKKVIDTQAADYGLGMNLPPYPYSLGPKR